jgi:hypothetical protein
MPAMSTIESLKPGQFVQCTVIKTPRAEAPVDTLQRLMRRDPAVVRGLRRSYKLRGRTTVTYNRGNRDWVQRQKCGRIVRCVVGATWTFRYDLSVLPDFKSVEKYVKIQAV